MPYDKELDRAVDQSSETLRSYQAANPVIPNAAKSPDIVTDPMQQLGYGGVNAGVVDLNARGTPSPGISESIDARTKSLVAARDGPVIAANALQVRGTGEAPGENPGPITAAAREAFAPGRTGAVSSQPQVTQSPSEPTLSVVPGIPNYKAEYAMMRAREGQDARELAVARAAADRAIQDNANEYYARIAAENAARGVYKPSIFDQMVTNASTVATPGGRGSAGPVIAAPVAAPRSVDINRDGVRQRNLVDETIAAQNAETARAQGAVTLQAEQLKLEQQKRINDLGSKLAAATDPKQRDQLSSTLLSLLGKDKPEEYQVIHAAGAESLAPDGFTKIKGPDTIVVLNKRTGAREVINLGAQAPGASADQFVKDQIYTDKNGRKAKYLGDGKWGPA